MAELSVERLREQLHYDPETGEWTWLTRTHTRPAGRRAGKTLSHGYHVIRVDDRLYHAGRLAFLYMIGRFPNPEIDHINRNRADDRWTNLREATYRLNALNRGLLPNNTSGLTGVTWNKRGRKWVAQTSVGNRNVYLGRFDTKEEAHRAYLDYLQNNVYRSE